MADEVQEKEEDTSGDDYGEDDDIGDDFDAYYRQQDFGDADETLNGAQNNDPEYFPFECLSATEVEVLLSSAVTNVSTSLKIEASLAKLLLHVNNWNVEHVINSYNNEVTKFLIESRVSPAASTSKPISLDCEDETCMSCPVCTNTVLHTKTLSLNCSHGFCIECWTAYVGVKINEGLSTQIPCMAQNCDLLVGEDMIYTLNLNDYQLLQYRQFSFHNFIASHPLLRFCIGPNCAVIFKAEKVLEKRVVCPQCNSSFCFKCGDNYHAPTDCATIKNWMTKCADDSETANYFSAHTKDCPNCNICIEKNGGCNHMQCYKCKHDFCWMCLGDWKGHGSEYYECSRYRENPDMANESAKARAALRKYLHYYERWQNHAKSLKLEEKTLEKIKGRINQKVMNGSGTWIDWQYLLDAAALLAKCRYTLQYTYPYAYYMTQKSKDLFEYQQGRLEAEIENLSWKIERAETTDRGELENQMFIAEKRRITLLKDFFQT